MNLLKMKNNCMQIYLAPLQGLTDWIFRESFYECIVPFDKSFSPFIRIEKGEFIRKSQCNDILPEHNQFQSPIPQFLGNDFESFKKFEELCLQYNYKEANINVGCPFPKVANHHLGSGLLSYPTEIDTLFEQIFSNTKLSLSVKCRLGQEEPSEFEEIIPILNKYPLQEVIIHARTGVQKYKGNVLIDAFEKYAKLLSHSVCYNGDICTIEDIEKIKKILPQLEKVMIGRGIFKNPFLLHEIKQLPLSSSEKMDKLLKFHFAIIERCSQKYSGNFSVLKRFEEMWEHHACMYDNPHKTHKLIKKCSNLARYKKTITEIISEQFN